MGRYRFTAYENDGQPRYLVIWDLQWRILDCQRLEPATDLRAAMAAAIRRLGVEGWLPEGSAVYGSVFIQRDGELRLPMLTPCDPYNIAAQSFDPFR